MKKKFAVLILSGIMILSGISACSGKTPENDKDSSTPVVSTEPEKSTQTSEKTTEGTENTTVSSENTSQTSESTTLEQTTETSSAVTTEDTELPDSQVDRDNTIVQTAEALLGIPFAENGSTPTEGFDNSGFIYYVLRQNGFINCPRLGRDQAAMGTQIGYGELKSGDLAFFSTGGSGNPDFGGIYIGGGKMIFSPMPGQLVREVDITSDYWKNCFVTGVSLS